MRVELQHRLQKGSGTASIFSGNALVFGFLDHGDLEICKMPLQCLGSSSDYVEEWQESVATLWNTSSINLAIHI